MSVGLPRFRKLRAVRAHRRAVVSIPVTGGAGLQEKHAAFLGVAFELQGSLPGLQHGLTVGLRRREEVRAARDLVMASPVRRS